MKKHILSLLLLLLAPCLAAAQNFEEYFSDSTLRLDYIFAGDYRQQHIYVDQLAMSPRCTDGAVDSTRCR